MGLGNFRKFDVQACWSLALSCVGAVCAAGAVAMIMYRWDPQLQSIVYGHGTKYTPVFMAAIAVGIFASLFGLFLGWNSAGQKRNDRQQFSWIGFFLGTFALSVVIVSAYAYVTLRQGLDFAAAS